MKKFLKISTIITCSTIIAIGLLCSIQANAQTFAGFKAGLSMSSVSSSTQYKESILPGIHIGFVSNFTLNYAWNFQAELLYNQKGYNHVICAGSYDKLSSAYVELPISFRHRAWPISTNLIMNIGGGFYGGYLLSGKYTTNLGNGETKQTLDVASLDKPYDAGLILDIGVERQVSKGKMFIDMRIQPGLMNTGVFPAESQSQRNISVMLSVSYMFGL